MDRNRKGTRRSLGLASVAFIATLFLIAACGTDDVAPEPEPAGPTAAPTVPGVPDTPTPTPDPEPEFDAEAHFSDRTVTIVVAFAPGGGYDVSARIAARFLPDHLPGRPNVIVQNLM